jgi:DNA-binding NarL/FixJ family response regulator
LSSAGMYVTAFRSSAARAAVARVLIADDQRLFRLGLEHLLSADTRLEVVGEADDGEEAVRQCEILQPDVVLMNIRMPGLDGIPATRRIVESGSSAKVVILASWDLESDVAAAFQAGASGFILKDTEAEALVRSVLAVHLGAHVFTGARPRQGIGFGGLVPGGPEPEGRLTPSERSILRMVASGVVNRDIAEELGISEKTVRNHMSHIYGKLNVRGRSEALLYAMRTGLVNS